MKETDAKNLCLSVADESEEAETAHRFAALHAARRGWRAAILAAWTPPPAGGEWVSIGEQMEEEERARAEGVLAHAGAAAAAACDEAGEAPALFLRRGPLEEAFLAVLGQEPVATVILAASSSGGGPLITAALSGGAGMELGAPLIILPSGLLGCSNEELARFA